ncbi:MAG: LytTR family DNA-binding domain-containing protein [Saprospiraceae bacterium]|nr:LytTR family DNA-binding domain-containing protein [Saprospiraceae bacterium]
MKITRRDWIELAFWVVVTLIFLYERRYLAQKIGLGHFVECVSVRLLLIVTLAYWNLKVLMPRFFETRKYVQYFSLLLLSLGLYITLQSWYDMYLYGFVIGIERDQHFWNVAPYNIVVTAWYVGLTVGLHRAMEWYVQSEELAKLYEENKILKAQAEVQPSQGFDNPNTVFLKTGTKQVKVELDNITHIQGLKDYSIIYTSDDRIVVRGNLKQMEQFFPEGQFLRVHKSYLVALEKIEAIDKNQVLLDQVSLPIGRSYKAHLDNFIKK